MDTTARSLLWSALRTRPRDLTVATILYSTHQLGEALVPVIVGGVVGTAVAHGTWPDIALWLVLLGADFAFLSMSYRFGARASMRAKQHTAHRVRLWLADRAVGRAGGVDHPPGDLLSRAASDADRIGAYAGMLATGIAQLIVLLASAVLLLRFSVPLGCIVLAGTALLLVVQHAVSAPLHRRSGHEQHERGRVTLLAEDIVRGVRVLKGIGAQRNAAAGYRRVSQDALTASMRAVSAQALLTAVGAALTGAYLLVIVVVGGWLALDGQLDLGRLIAALGLAQFVAGPMQTLAGMPATSARALASAERVREVLQAEPVVADPEIPDAAVPSPGPGELRLEDVDLGVAGLTLTGRVIAGRMTGIVCGHPVAAARIPLLIAREQDPVTGEILLDGSLLAALPLRVLRSRVLVALHDAVLLPGTIAQNLSALRDLPPGNGLSAEIAAPKRGGLSPRNASARDEASAHSTAAVVLGGGPVARAAHAAGVDEIAEAVPGGLDASVGDRGETLSGGQRQRVALARALAADAAVLVLHDPTTAVDSATEDDIARRVHALRAGRTTLVVTTDPAWLHRCEQVILVDGRGCRSGTHDELMDDAAYRSAVTR